APLDLNNIQGDILGGLPKKTETYFFFKITDAAAFRKHLKQLIPLITTTAQVQKDRKAIDEHKKSNQKSGKPPELLPLAGVNIAFSHAGLKKLGINDDNLGDTAFKAGQLADAQNLGDPGTGNAGAKFVPDWDPAFKEKDIHGVILVAGDSHETVDKKLQEIEAIFGVGGPHASIHEVLTIQGDVRPGDEKGHEHFGFQDGISQPAVKGFDTNPNPGQAPVRPGVILVGRDGDSVANNARPSWAKDGSFLVFRKLQQLVPEFNKFLEENPIKLPGNNLTPEEGSELLGARLVGRWKSGAPIDITPLQDDPELAKDPQRNNNFRFDHPFADEQDSQTRCPFAAHIRKTNPRADLEDASPTSVESRRIIRRGIPYGPEVTPEEKESKKTKHDRGLLFVCYQSNIENGFQFIQKSWANNPNFPPSKPNPVTPGFDPIIGQAANNDGARTMSGTDPNNQANELSLPTELFVVPRGGEYFFSPSISALKDTFAA
uniref:ancestral D-type dye decolorizing peroxidase n=1 Tax=Geotrichum candidum TaxID=1173061 RepID=UPI0018EA31C2|nr:Chain A, ancestral D-type dye decolorizing peroxidase [Geotrichum candidum]